MKKVLSIFVTSIVSIGLVSAPPPMPPLPSLPPLPGTSKSMTPPKPPAMPSLPGKKTGPPAPPPRPSSPSTPPKNAVMMTEDEGWNKPPPEASNWRDEHKFYKEASDAVEKIQEALEKFDKLEAKIDIAADEIDKKLDDFYSGQSEAVGRFSQAINDVEKYIQKKAMEYELKDSKKPVDDNVASMVRSLKADMQLWRKDISDIEKEQADIDSDEDLIRSKIIAFKKAAFEVADLYQDATGKRNDIMGKEGEGNEAKIIEEINSILGKVEPRFNEVNKDIEKDVFGAKDSLMGEVAKSEKMMTGLEDRIKAMRDTVEKIGKREEEIARVEEERLAKSMDRLMEKNEELVQHRFVEAAAEGNVLSRAVRSVLIRFFEGVKSIFSWLKPKSKEEDVKRSRTTGFEEKERVFGDGLRELKKSIVDAVIKGCDYVLALYKKVGKEPVAVKVGVSGSAKVPSDSEYKPAKAKLPPTPGASKKAPPPPPKGLPPLPGAGPNKKVKKLSPPKMPAGLKKPPPPPPPSLPSLPPLPPMPS